MQPENAIHRFDLGRFDKAGMCDRGRMQDTFERFLPEFQKDLQLGKFGAEIVILPDIGLQQPGMIRAPIYDVCRGPNPQSPMVRVFPGCDKRKK